MRYLLPPTKWQSPVDIYLGNPNTIFKYEEHVMKLWILTILQSRWYKTRIGLAALVLRSSRSLKTPTKRLHGFGTKLCLTQQVRENEALVHVEPSQTGSPRPSHQVPWSIVFEGVTRLLHDHAVGRSFVGTKAFKTEANLNLTKAPCLGIGHVNHQCPQHRAGRKPGLHPEALISHHQ